MIVTFNDGLIHEAPVAKEHQNTIFDDIAKNGVVIKEGYRSGSWRPFHTIKQIDWRIED